MTHRSTLGGITHRLLPPFVLATLLAVGACGPRPEPAAGTGTAPTGGRDPADASAPLSTEANSILGVPLGGSPAQVAEALGVPPPDRPATDEPTGHGPIELAFVMAGVTGRLAVHFHEERASDFTFETTGAAATEAAYRALTARAAEDLGPGAATRCESEDGIPFDEYLATGNGGLRTEWRGGPRSGELALTKDYPQNGALRIRAFFAWVELLPPMEDFVRGPDTAPRVAGGPAARPAPARAAKQAPAGCTVDLSGAPTASILDLPFGADRAAIETQLGRPFEEDHGQLFLPHELAGVPGRLHVAFYDGCLAVVMFLVDGEAATTANYLALRDWARGTMLGPGDGFRCLSEAGADEHEYIAAGFGLRATNWRGHEPLDGSLWFHQAWSQGPGRQIVFEADYLPLRGHAPEINFSGDGAPGPRPPGPTP